MGSRGESVADTMLQRGLLRPSNSFVSHGETHRYSWPWYPEHLVTWSRPTKLHLLGLPSSGPSPYPPFFMLSFSIQSSASSPSLLPTSGGRIEMSSVPFNCVFLVQFFISPVPPRPVVQLLCKVVESYTLYFLPLSTFTLLSCPPSRSPAGKFRAIK